MCLAQSVTGRSVRSAGAGMDGFWVGPDHVVIAHRFAFAMTHGLVAAVFPSR